jgi:hypothetical protein
LEVVELALAFLRKALLPLALSQGGAESSFTLSLTFMGSDRAE